jgi:hypothetical protein
MRLETVFEGKGYRGPRSEGKSEHKVEWESMLNQGIKRNLETVTEREKGKENLKSRNT